MPVYATGAGMYAGIQVGQTNLNNVDMNVNTGQPLPPATVCDTSTNATESATCLIVLTTPDNTGIGERFFIGANINPYAGFEIGFTNYANSEYNPDVSGFTHQPQIRVYSMEILGKLMYPIYNFSVFAKGGFGIIYQSISGALLTDNPDDSGDTYTAAPAVGIGIGYDITPTWNIDFSANKIFSTDDTQAIDFYGIGISYHWVDEYCGQFLC